MEKGRTMATKIVRDNCKDCTSSCEHAGKDREFVCVKGVSCKTVKPKPEMVAVVRCKDCEFAEPYERMDGETGYYCRHQKHSFVYDALRECEFNPVKEKNDFCSYGERKTDE